MTDARFDNLFGWDLNRMYEIPGMVLTMYDSIMFEAPDDMAEELAQFVIKIMKYPVEKLGCSLKLDYHITQRWWEYKKEKEEEEIPEEEKL